MKRNFTIALALLLSFAASNIVAQATTFTIKGRVSSFEESLAFAGVDVYIKGTNIHTTTKTDGTFSLDVSKEHKTLVFELKDYQTQEVAITSQKHYAIILRRNQNNAGAIQNFQYNYSSAKLPAASLCK
jgi:Ca2+-binding RTX toxin-like protein